MSPGQNRCRIFAAVRLRGIVVSILDLRMKLNLGTLACDVG